MDEAMLRVLQTPCGSLTMSCATCAHSTFARGNLQTCELRGDAQVYEDDDCELWSPLAIAGVGHFFGTEHGERV